MSETVIFGKIKYPELLLLNFRDQLQCMMGRNERFPSKYIRHSRTRI